MSDALINADGSVNNPNAPQQPGERSHPERSQATFSWLPEQRRSSQQAQRKLRDATRAVKWAAEHYPRPMRQRAGYGRAARELDDALLVIKRSSSTGNELLEKHGVLSTAAGTGRVVVVKMLLRHFPNIDKKNALMDAAVNGQAATVKELVGAGANVNVRVDVGITASKVKRCHLAFPARHGHPLPLPQDLAQHVFDEARIVVGLLGDELFVFTFE